MAEIATILAYAAALLAVAAMAATTIRQLRYAMFVAGFAALAHFALTEQLGWAIIAAVFDHQWDADIGAAPPCAARRDAGRGNQPVPAPARY